MGENNDSFFDKILSKNIDEEIPIDVNLIDTSAKRFTLYNENKYFYYNCISTSCNKFPIGKIS